MNKRTKTALRRWCLYGWTLAKWTMAASAIGVVCGLIGTMFHFGVHEVTAFRGTHPWVLYLLPLAGFVIVSFYKLTETDGLGTDDIIDAVHAGKRLPILLLPAIFFGTVLTHLCGGSAGREGAALQMGGTIGQCMGRTFRLDDRDLRVATLAGMAAFFSALFGTPLAATVFAIMVISIGVLYHVALYPSLLAALVAYGVSVRLGVEPTRFTVAVPDQSVGMFVRVAALGVLCALVSILFCKLMHGAGHLMKRIKNPWLRVICGGFAVIALTWVFGTDYNGAGMDVVTLGLPAEVGFHGGHAGSGLQGRRGGALLLRGCDLRLRSVSAAGSAGWLRRRGRSGCCFLRRDQLPGGVHAAGSGTVRRGGNAVFCLGLLPELYALRVSGTVFQPDHPLFQVESTVHQRPYQRLPRRRENRIKQAPPTVFL